MKKYSRENLIRVETFVEEFSLDNESINAEFNTDEISLNQLQAIFESEDGDDDLYLCYEINEKIAFQINSYLKVPIAFDFAKYCYHMQRYGEYGDI